MARMNPQRIAFKEAYCNPESATFGNAYKSAIEAGFAEEYAKNITAQGVEWVSEIIRDVEMGSKAERVLNEMLDLRTEKVTLTKDGAELSVTDPALIKIKQDTAKFVTERLLKHRYSTRQELTGADGKDLIPDDEEYEVALAAITAFLYEEDTDTGDSGGE